MDLMENLLGNAGSSGLGLNDGMQAMQARLQILNQSVAMNVAMNYGQSLDQRLVRISPPSGPFDQAQVVPCQEPSPAAIQQVHCGSFPLVFDWLRQYFYCPACSRGFDITDNFISRVSRELAMAEIASHEAINTVSRSHLPKAQPIIDRSVPTPPITSCPDVRERSIFEPDHSAFEPNHAVFAADTTSLMPSATVIVGDTRFELDRCGEIVKEEKA